MCECVPVHTAWHVQCTFMDCIRECSIWIVKNGVEKEVPIPEKPNWNSMHAHQNTKYTKMEPSRC